MRFSRIQKKITYWLTHETKEVAPINIYPYSKDASMSGKLLRKLTYKSTLVYPLNLLLKVCFTFQLHLFLLSPIKMCSIILMTQSCKKKDLGKDSWRIHPWVESELSSSPNSSAATTIIIIFMMFWCWSIFSFFLCTALSVFNLSLSFWRPRWRRKEQQQGAIH